MSNERLFELMHKALRETHLRARTASELSELLQQQQAASATRAA